MCCGGEFRGGYLLPEVCPLWIGGELVQMYLSFSFSLKKLSMLILRAIRGVMDTDWSVMGLQSPWWKAREGKRCSSHCGVVEGLAQGIGEYPVIGDRRIPDPFHCLPKTALV